MTRTKFSTNFKKDGTKIMDSLGRKASAGRGGLFQDRYISEGRKLALLGMTVKQMADFWKVKERTVTLWLKKKPKFRKAVDQGRWMADMNVVDSMYKRAIGFHYNEIEVTTKELTPKEGAKYKEIKNIKTVRKLQIPDVGAGKWWLSCRQRENGIWVNRLEADVNHQGQVDLIHSQSKQIPIEELSEEEREFLFRVGMKQLAHDGQRNN